MRLAAAVLVASMLPAIALAKPKKPPPPPRWQTLTAPTDEMPKASTTGFVDTDGASIYYATYGVAKGEPVVLLHGGMGNSDQWVLQIPPLAEKVRVIVIDSRGQGRSTRSKGKPSYDVMANDVIAVMDQLKLPKASIVGWSDGGEIG